MTLCIAVVDDSALELKWTEMQLAALGHEVHTYNRSIGIQAFVQQSAPDVLLLDVNMPALTGDTLCKMLKSNPKTRHVAVLLYSSMDPDELRGLAASCGADGFVLKNHDSAALAAALADRAPAGS